MNNKGYIFQNYFDVVCYLVVSTIYPLLTFFVQSNQPSEDILSKLNCIITGLFFTATFFYDYYQRYRDCSEQTASVVNILFFGRLGFFILAALSFLSLVIIVGDFLPDINTKIMAFCEKLPFSAFYPLVMAVIEIGKRMYLERKGKITRVKV